MMDILWILWTLPSVLAIEGKMFLPRVLRVQHLAESLRVYRHGTLVLKGIQEIRYETIFSLINECGIILGQM